MMRIADRITKRRQGQKGATMIEYALIAALISIVAILALRGISTGVNNTFEQVDNAL